MPLGLFGPDREIGDQYFGPAAHQLGGHVDGRGKGLLA